MTIKAEYLFTAFGSISTNDSKINPLDDTANPPDFACGATTGLGQGGTGLFPVPEPTPRQCFDHKADLFLHSLRIGLNIKF
jgi:hypothetical protein